MRLKALQRLLETTDADAYLVTDIKNIYYFTGFKDISEATLNLLITLKGNPILFVSPLSIVAAKENAKGCLIREVQPLEMLDSLVAAIKDMKIEKVYFDKLSSQIYLEFIEKIRIKLVPNPTLIWNIRKVKDETELTYIRKAAELAVIGLEAGVETVKPGIREYEIAAEIEYAMRLKGAEGVSFETIVASGPRSAYPHGLCSDRIVNSGDLVTIDLGAVYRGYCSDITRTFVVGKASPKQRRILNLVLEAQEEAFKKVRAGIRAKDIDASARKILSDNRYGKYFVHGLGHGVGLDVHELPTLSPSSEDFLEEGNVITDEPGIYIEGFGGVRIEDMVLVLKNKGERLTNASYYL